ncbi:MAG: hypothetical protein WCE49_14455, partial [Terrimicrobiaceae bacterium]
MHRVIRIVLLSLLACVLSVKPAAGQQPTASPAKPIPEPTPIPLANVPFEMQSAMAALDDIDASVSRVQSSTDEIVASFSNLAGEIDPRMAEDSRLLRSSTSLDILYRIKLNWQDFATNLSALARELTQRAASLDEDLARLEKMDKVWKATLQSAKDTNVPAPALQRVQSVVDAVEQKRQAVESDRARVLTALSQFSDEEGRIRKTLSSVKQAQIRALKGLLLRQSPFFWGLRTGLGTEWIDRSGESLSSQLKASTAFSKRLPSAFLIQAVLIVVIAVALQSMRRGVQKLAKEKPELQRALPILDLPVSTAFVLSVLISPSLLPQAPRLIQVILATLALIPSVVILRRLLDRRLSPILYALVIMFFVDQLRILAVSLPELARLLFLAQMLGGLLFLLWLLRSQHLRTGAAETNARFSKAIRVIARIGLIFLSTAFLANVFGYVDLGNLLGMLFLRSIYIAALLYPVVRILEGLLIIALE